MRQTPPLTIRQRVRIYLAQHDMTQGALAQQIGMSEPRMSLILAGKARPNINEATQFQRIVGIPATDFAERVA